MASPASPFSLLARWKGNLLPHENMSHDAAVSCSWLTFPSAGSFSWELPRNAGTLTMGNTFFRTSKSVEKSCAQNMQPNKVQKICRTILINPIILPLWPIWNLRTKLPADSNYLSSSRTRQTDKARKLCALSSCRRFLNGNTDMQIAMKYS